MMDISNHKDLVIRTDPRDYVMGDGNVPFKAVSSGNWQPYLDFFERQDINYETNGCVLFTAQEDFDAQIENLIQLGKIPTGTLKLFNELGYMDSVNSLDGKPHFHSSPRFLQILTGNGYNGNALQDPWIVMRTKGILPWVDLPFGPTIPQSLYLTGITQAMLDKAQQFLLAIGGSSSIQYQQLNQGGPTNLAVMQQALFQAPLQIGINVGANWNQINPTPPPAGSLPGHSVMNYEIVAGGCWIYDHYEPNPKDLLAGYPVQYVLQAVVSVTPPPPSPELPPNPTVPQTVDWLTQLQSWLQNLLNSIKH
jgi:hypothetical protein